MLDYKQRCRMALQILQATNDGGLLNVNDLNLVENAVNGRLNQLGWDMFIQLYKRVIIDRNLGGFENGRKTKE